MLVNCAQIRKRKSAKKRKQGLQLLEIAGDRGWRLLPGPGTSRIRASDAVEGPELDLLPLSPEHTQGNSGCPRPAWSLDTAIFIPQQAWDSECLHNDYENIPKYERWSRKAREVKESDCSCHNFWSRQPVSIKCHRGRWRECRRARKVSRNYVKESEVLSDSFVTPWTVAYQVPLSMGFSR